MQSGVARYNVIGEIYKGQEVSLGSQKSVYLSAVPIQVTWLVERRCPLIVCIMLASLCCSNRYSIV